MESQHRRELNFRVNASQTPAADAPWHATAFPHPQPVPSELSHPRLDPRQLHGCTGVVHDNNVSDWHCDVLPVTRAHPRVPFLAPNSG